MAIVDDGGVHGRFTSVVFNASLQEFEEDFLEFFYFIFHHAPLVNELDFLPGFDLRKVVFNCKSTLS